MPTGEVGPVPIVRELRAVTSGVSIFAEGSFEDQWNPESPTDNTTQLTFGTKFAPGIEFSADIDIPSGSSGTIEWVQTVMISSIFEGRQGKPSRRLDYDDHWYLDYGPVYPLSQSISLTNSKAQNIRISVQDDPYIELSPEFIRGSLEEKFRMFIMWRPAGASFEERITLSAIEWGWSATVENRTPQQLYEKNPFIQQWEFVSSSCYPNPVGYGTQIEVLPDLSSPLNGGTLEWEYFTN